MKRALLIILALSLALGAGAQSLPELKMGVGASSGSELRSLFSKIYAEAGYSLTMVELPTARQAYALENGEIDCLIFSSEATIAAEIKKGVRVGVGDKPLFTYEILGFALSERVGAINAAGTFKDLKIGYTQGNRAQEGAIKGAGAAPEPVTDVGGGVQMLSRGRIDVLLGVEGALEPVLKANGLVGKVQQLAKPLVSFAYYHVLAEKRAGLAPKVAASVRKYEKELTALLQR